MPQAAVAIGGRRAAHHGTFAHVGLAVKALLCRLSPGKKVIFWPDITMIGNWGMTGTYPAPAALARVFRRAKELRQAIDRRRGKQTPRRCGSDSRRWRRLSSTLNSSPTRRHCARYSRSARAEAPASPGGMADKRRRGLLAPQIDTGRWAIAGLGSTKINGETVDTC